MIQPFHNQLDEWEEISVKMAISVAGTSGILSLLHTLSLITMEIMAGTQWPDFFSHPSFNRRISEQYFYDIVRYAFKPRNTRKPDS